MTCDRYIIWNVWRNWHNFCFWKIFKIDPLIIAVFFIKLAPIFNIFQKWKLFWFLHANTFQMKWRTTRKVLTIFELILEKETFQRSFTPCNSSGQKRSIKPLWIYSDTSENENFLNLRHKTAKERFLLYVH